MKPQVRRVSNVPKARIVLSPVLSWESRPHHSRSTPASSLPCVHPARTWVVIGGASGTIWRGRDSLVDGHYASRDAASPERVLTPCNERIKSAYSMDARRVARCQPGLGLPGDAAARRARGASTTRIQCRYVGLLSSGPRSAPAVGSSKLQSVGRLDSRCSRCAPPAAPTVASSPVNLSETAIWSTRQLAVILLTGLGFIWWSPRYRGIQVAGPAPAHLIAARASG